MNQGQQAPTPEHRVPFDISAKGQIAHDIRGVLSMHPAVRDLYTWKAVVRLPPEYLGRVQAHYEKTCLSARIS